MSRGFLNLEICTKNDTMCFTLHKKTHISTAMFFNINAISSLVKAGLVDGKQVLTNQHYQRFHQVLCDLHQQYCHCNKYVLLPFSSFYINFQNSQFFKQCESMQKKRDLFYFHMLS